MSAKKSKAPAWWVKAMGEDIEAALNNPHRNPELVSGIARLAREQERKARAKLPGGKPGRKVGAVDAIRAELRKLHKDHEDKSAAALARMVKTKHPRICGARSLRTLERYAGGVISEDTHAV